MSDFAGAAAAEPVLQIYGVSKRFGDTPAVHNLSLEIARGEFFALLGPSGCGKSTLLRLIAGFEAPDTGRIILDGREIAGTPPHRRPVNMMFQSYALFPHMSVAGNVAFGLKQDGVRRAELRQRVGDILKLVQLDGFENRRPDELSGGQRQRVALARALVKQPTMLLLDEPLAALDRRLREQTQSQLKRLQRELGLTFVVVTHDQEEAMSLADRIAVMQQGEIAQLGTPAEVYEQPNSRYVATFLGDVNLIEGTVEAFTGSIMTILTGAAGRLKAPSMPAAKRNAAAAVATRPEKLTLAAVPPDSPNVNSVRGRVVDIGYAGNLSTYVVDAGQGLRMKATAPNQSRGAERAFAVGEDVWVTWPIAAGFGLLR